MNAPYETLQNQWTGFNNPFLLRFSDAIIY